MISHLRARADRRLLVGAWAAAIWAIGFYERQGFQLVPETIKARLLRTYWTVSARQIETSVVLAAPSLTEGEAMQLVDAADSRDEGEQVSVSELGPQIARTLRRRLTTQRRHQ